MEGVGDVFVVLEELEQFSECFFSPSLNMISYFVVHKNDLIGVLCV